MAMWLKWELEARENPCFYWEQLMAMVLVRWSLTLVLLGAFIPNLTASSAVYAVDSLPNNPGFQNDGTWDAKAVAELKGNFWPQYRGPRNDSVAETTGKVPTQWNETSNVRWKTEIAGRGWSSPLVWGDYVWMTNASPEGKEMSICGVELATGKLVVNQLVFTNESVQKDFDKSNSYASPTPVTDGKRLYAHFGAYGTAAIDISKVTSPLAVDWMRRDILVNHFRGPGSSPILFKNLVIFHMDGFDQQYAIALNKDTGETVWRTDRKADYGTTDGDMMKGYATPTIIYIDGKPVMISVASKVILGMNPADGKEIWRVKHDEHSAASKPLFDGDRIFTNTGFSKGKLMAIRLGGAGDVTQSHVDWVASRGVGSKPSPVAYRDWIFSTDDRGIVTCFKKKDGEVVWQKRLGGKFSGSPIIADGKLYTFDEEGKGYVFDASGEEKLISENTLESGCMASPVAVNDFILLRTKTHLYCLGKG